MMETERIKLRRWQDSDAEALFKYASDPDVGPRAGWPAHQTVEESLEIIRTVFHNDCEVGYWVGKPFWNKGICTEALTLMLDYCINVKHFRLIWADHFTGNPASGRVMEKCGFQDTGLLNRCSNLTGGDTDMVRIYKTNGFRPQEDSL